MFRPPIALTNRNRSIFILSPSFVSGFQLTPFPLLMFCHYTLKR